MDIPSIQILPALGAVIDPPLEIIRRIIAWSIVLAFGVVSLVLARIIIKIKGFIQLLQTPDGRRLVLTNLSIYLFFFVIFCSLFFLWPGR